MSGMDREALDRLLSEAIGWPTEREPTPHDIVRDLLAVVRSRIERRERENEKSSLAPGRRGAQSTPSNGGGSV